MISPWKSGFGNPSTMSWTGPIAILSPIRHERPPLASLALPAGRPAHEASRLLPGSTSPRRDEPRDRPGPRTGWGRSGHAWAAPVAASWGALRGMSSAATHPTIAKTPKTTIAAAKGLSKDPEAPATIDPAMATPSDDPRFETLRETPEMSPWTLSGQADCTRFTD